MNRTVVVTLEIDRNHPEIDSASKLVEAIAACDRLRVKEIKDGNNQERYHSSSGTGSSSSLAQQIASVENDTRPYGDH